MVDKDILEKAYEKAKDVIRECSTKNGLYASGGKNGYKGVWARDSMISLIGASCLSYTSKNEKYSKLFKEQFEKSLNTLGKHQSEKGEIPNAVLKFEKKNPQVDFHSIDSSLWFVIGHYIYKKRFGNGFFNKNRKKIKKAITWLDYQDVGKDLMIEQLPTTDWQDAFPHRYGRTINTQALYYLMLNLIGEKKKSEKLKNIVNNNEDLKLWGKDFYYSYRWKNHGKYKEIGNWFDSFGNLLAVLFELADRKRAKKIISHVKKNRINKPFPMKAIFPAIRRESKYWQDYFNDCAAGKPYNYLNAGIWTYIGGFYVLALIKLKKFKEAEKELKILAEANIKNKKNIFPEWINPVDKTSHGNLQAWSAGAYILAYNSFKKRRVLI